MVPRDVDPSLRETVPEGLPLAVFTLAAIVTAWPNTGFSTLLPSINVVEALVIEMEELAELLLNEASPL